MAVRQELLYYVKQSPTFNVEAEYTDIPKILRGYYKEVMENTERSRADTIRAGNVWVDVQQVFYRMEENVSGCYTQKPLKCIQRIFDASLESGDLVIDFLPIRGPRYSRLKCSDGNVSRSRLIRSMRKQRSAVSNAFGRPADSDGRTGIRFRMKLLLFFSTMVTLRKIKICPAGKFFVIRMERLQKELESLLTRLPNLLEVRDRLASLGSVYPFNEYIIATLLAMNVLTLEGYHELRDAYIERNFYLYIFGISAPRTFSEAWAQGHRKELVSALRKPSKKLDLEYAE